MNDHSHTTYGDVGLGEVVEHMTRGRLGRSSRCHLDPMFEGGRCAFGQTAAAQGHLRNNNVGIGDVFLFFGLFSNLDGTDRHHRIFGFLEVEQIDRLEGSSSVLRQPAGFSIRHPHTIGEWDRNNTIYLGRGQTAISDLGELRLSRVGEPLSHWRVPPWLREAGLTYHGRAERWKGDDTLVAVGRGQEFVADISDIPKAKRWLNRIIKAIENEST